MIKYLFLPIFLIVMNCTTLEKPLDRVEIEKIKKEITLKTEEIKEVVKINEINRLNEIFLPTLKNKIILNNLKKYSLDGLTFMFSEATQVSKVKAKSIMIINYGTDSNYYTLTWEKDNINGQWKISNVAEKN